MSPAVLDRGKALSARLGTLALALDALDIDPATQAVAMTAGSIWRDLDTFLHDLAADRLDPVQPPAEVAAR